jgi:hypothetical protein
MTSELRKTCEMRLAFDAPCHEPTTHAYYAGDGQWRALCIKCADLKKREGIFVVSTTELFKGAQIKWQK